MDSDDENSTGELAHGPYAGAGAMLREAREARGLELANIAAETRIALRQLQLIEAGDFDALPSRTYALGFARTYARIVGVDERKIAEAVRAELADGANQRPRASAVMEPGDPAKLPSSKLAWFAAAAAIILIIGAITFFNTYFAAGRGPAPQVAEAAPENAADDAAEGDSDAPAVAAGTVVLTALQDGVWLRLYEQDGERLLERTLKLGESVTVPADAIDPRLNTGRPDALRVTINGREAARLSDQPVTLSGEPVSAAALLARVVATPPAVASTPRAEQTPSAPSATSATAETPAPQRIAPIAAPPTSAPISAPAPAPAAERTAAAETDGD
jgi:cytoskeleton protein RodZ